MVKFAPQASDPPIVKYMKYGTIITVGITTMGAAAGWLGTNLIRWAVVPIVEQQLKAGEVRDSLIVSRLEAMSGKQDELARALSYPEGSQWRDEFLRRARRIEPEPITLPKDAQNKDEEKDKEKL